MHLTTMSERRYSEEEIAAIFERAEEAQNTGVHRTRQGEGLTLPELQDIGREVGIGPEHIAEAARGVDRAGQPTTRRFAGLPLGVGRTVHLPRKLREEEWQRLVLDLRQTFDARGKIRTEGGFREWTNGNLQALLEPTPEGERLRLRTVKGSARALMSTGLIMGAVSTVLLVAAVLTGVGSEAGRGMDLVTIGLIGGGLFGFSAIQLPGWARQRRSQMKDVADRLVAALSDPPDPEHDDGASRA